MKYSELTPELERDLLTRYRAGDRGAGATLIAALGGILAKQAKRYRRRQDFEDAMQNATVATLVAARKFDWSTGLRFASYVEKCALGGVIKGAYADSTIRVNHHVHDKVRQYEKRGEKLPRHLALAMTIYSSRSLNDTFTVQSQFQDLEGELSIESRMASEDPDPERYVVDLDATERARDIVERALAELTPREAEIVRRAHLLDEPQNFAEIGAHFCLTRERIRQIHDQAMEKFERAVKRTAAKDDAVLWNGCWQPVARSEAA